jgi:hypothetical protein
MDQVHRMVTNSGLACLKAVVPDNVACLLDVAVRICLCSWTSPDRTSPAPVLCVATQVKLDQILIQVFSVLE